ncbi:MAG: hypothetical protein WCK57_00010 [Verrucomicrobiae bacterium]
MKICLKVIVWGFLLSGVAPKAHAAFGLAREAYGVWDRGGGHLVSDYPYTLGQAYFEYWANIETSRNYFNWTNLDNLLQFADDQNQKFNVQISPIGGGFGSTVPLWMSNNVPLFTESPNVAGYTYGYYLNTNYQTYYREMVEALAYHVRQELPPNLQARIAFVRCDTGATGDEAPYENPNYITNIYQISNTDWRAFRLWAFEVYRHAFQDGTNGPVIPLLFQDIEKTGFPIEWGWVTNTVKGGFGGKLSGPVRGHNFNGSQDVSDSYREYSVGGSLKIFSRNEMDQSWQKTFMYQSNLVLNMYWCAVEQLHPGMSVWDISSSCLESASASNFVSSLLFFNKWSAQLDPPTAGGGFCIFHDGLDASDTVRFPEAKYGTASNSNTNRFLAICATNAIDGARMDDVDAVTRGALYQRNNQNGFNDSAWGDVPENYERFITQLEPTNSPGVWRIYGATNGVITSTSHPFDRFGRRFDHANAKDAMYFDITDSLVTSPGQRVELTVIYRDKGTGQFALLYDAVTNSQKTAFTVTKSNSLTWKTNMVVVTDWAFANRGPKGADLVLTNLGTEDTIFHSVELIKFADVNVGTVGKGTVSGRTDGTVYTNIMGTFMERQRLELTVTPAVGWRFTGWSGELSGTNLRPFLFPSKDSRVTANFAFVSASGGSTTSADDFNLGTLTGGTGWSGGWTNTGTVTVIPALIVELDGGGNGTNQFTRTFAVPVTNASLSFDWDLDRIGVGESGTVSVFQNVSNTWRTVWTQTDPGLDANNAGDANLVTTNINLSAYGSISQLRFTLNADASNNRFYIDNVNVTGTPSVTATNTQPLFSSDPISETPATNGVAYAATLADNASDPGSKPLTFTKLSGPAWLNVATNGVLSGNPTNAIVGLNSWLVRITNGVGGGDDAILLINVNAAAPSNSAYSIWANQYQLVQGPNGNDDGDSLSNLGEFALGGNPTNSSDLGYPITYGLKIAGGTNWFEYAYPKRSDPNSGLLYYLELATNLASPVWTNSGYTVTGSGPLTNGFLSVTNRLETNVKAQQFIRLMIQAQ